MTPTLQMLCWAVLFLVVIALGLAWGIFMGATR
jgi:hypothetical protein